MKNNIEYNQIFLTEFKEALQSNKIKYYKKNSNSEYFYFIKNDILFILYESDERKYELYKINMNKFYDLEDTIKNISISWNNNLYSLIYRVKYNMWDVLLKLFMVRVNLDLFNFSDEIINRVKSNVKNNEKNVIDIELNELKEKLK